MANNLKIAEWDDIRLATEQRMRENEARAAQTTDPEILVLLRRIQLDDMRWLKISQEFITWHKDR